MFIAELECMHARVYVRIRWFPVTSLVTIGREVCAIEECVVLSGHMSACVYAFVRMCVYMCACVCVYVLLYVYMHV